MGKIIMIINGRLHSVKDYTLLRPNPAKDGASQTRESLYEIVCFKNRDGRILCDLSVAKRI